MRFTPLALAAGLLAGGAARGELAAPPPAAAASAAGPGVPGAASLQPSVVLQTWPRTDAAQRMPSVVQARHIVSQPDFLTTADGDAEFRRAGLVIHADHLSYDAAQDLATARGKVRIIRDNAIYGGPLLALQVARFQGYFLDPTFEFPQFGSGGKAKRFDFIDAERSHATQVEYTSCVRDGSAEPAWLLRADSMDLDLENSVGVAQGGVLDFLGVPILALPKLSFPLSEARRSGWLPPSLGTDNRSGVEVSEPYYWDIAPNRDATITPRVISRRGVGMNTEFRYLEPGMQGMASVEWLPNDRLTGTSRESYQWTHDWITGPGWHYTVNAVHVSDDGWWKDFPDTTRSITPRLLPMRASAELPLSVSGGQGLVYVRADGWQVLQGSATDPTVTAPYQRSPQIGVRLDGGFGGWRYDLDSEFNHFTLPSGTAARDGRSEGSRLHLLGDLSWPWRAPGWFVVPKFSLNAASYADTGLEFSGGHSSRLIPSFSLDTGLDFERQTEAFGRNFRQTLEPRLFYVLTPHVSQSGFPVYDSTAKDFNFSSIYSVNQFSGVDRVSDGNLLTAGLTTRFVDAASGAEALRLGIAQRYLLSTQRETAQPDGTPDGPATDQHLSDLLLLGSTSLVPKWSFSSTLDYSPVQRRSASAVAGAAYSPSLFHTLSLTYSFTRGQSDQVAVGWQWPIWSRRSAPATRSLVGNGTHCGGTWYSVGRINYSRLDSRVTDALVGAEYDAGCWIARVVGERLSIGTSESTTRVMFQLELVGLSRLGSNPLQVLKDNIPGYRLLREPRSPGSTPDDSQTTPYD